MLDDISFTGLELSYAYYHRKNHEDKVEFIKEIDALTNIETAKYNVLLSHSPVNTIADLTLNNSKNINKFELVLSGHMHNGLVFNIFDGKVYVKVNYKKYYISDISYGEMVFEGDIPMQKITIQFNDSMEEDVIKLRVF